MYAYNSYALWLLFLLSSSFFCHFRMLSIYFKCIRFSSAAVRAPICLRSKISLISAHNIFQRKYLPFSSPSTLQAGPLLLCTRWGSRRGRRGILASFGDTLLTCSLTLYGCHCEGSNGDCDCCPWQFLMLPAA